MIATVLHLHVGTGLGAEAIDHGVRGLAGRHDVVDLHALAAAGQQRLEGAEGNLLGVADDGIDLRHGAEAAGLNLCRTAGDDDADTWLLTPQPADGLGRLAHGLAGDRAGVDDRRILQPSSVGVLPHHLRFEGVEATAERDDLQHPWPWATLEVQCRRWGLRWAGWPAAGRKGGRLRVGRGLD